MRRAIATRFVVVLLLILLVGVAGLVATLTWGHVGKSEAVVVLVLSLGLVALVVIDRYRSPARPRVRRVALLGMVTLFGAALMLRGHDKIPDLVRGNYVASWNVYHYYLGSKYFEELGYFDLYKYTFLADREGDQILRKVKTTRDLHDYSYVSVESQLATIEESAFTPERWSAFKTDLTTLFDMTPARTSRNMVGDLGYNATPFGHFVFSGLAHAFSLQSATSRAILFSLDWIVLFPTLVLVSRAFGLIRGLAVGTSFLLFFAVAKFHFGAMFRFHWFAAALAGIALYRLDHMRAAGVAFGIAVAERVFPVLFLVGPAAHALIRLIRRREIERGKWRFGTSFALTMVVTTILGASVGRGVDNYREFDENMSNHSTYQYVVSMKFGLKRIFSHDFDRDKKQPGKVGRRKTFEQQRAYYWGALAIMLGCIGYLIARTDECDGVLFGIGLAFCLTVMSRYYWSLWFVLLLAGPTLYRQRWKRAVFDAAVVGIIPLFYLVNIETNDSMELYTLTNLYVVGCFVAFAVMRLTETAVDGQAALPTIPVRKAVRP